MNDQNKTNDKLLHVGNYIKYLNNELDKMTDNIDNKFDKTAEYLDDDFDEMAEYFDDDFGEMAEYLDDDFEKISSSAISTLYENSENSDKNLIMAKKIAAAVSKAGGRAYFAGGFVRDRLMGIESKDIDIEIHDIEPETLRAILSNFGEISSYGESFGIYGIKGYDLDIAMPRREKAVSPSAENPPSDGISSLKKVVDAANIRGHRDFEIDVDPYLGNEAASRRRDFTMNALMQDVLTDELIDHFGGEEDIYDGVIRLIDPVSFAEDPLRVLRAAQFAARFMFDIDEDTAEVMSGMDISSLAKERVFEEMKKALLKSEIPSRFFWELRRLHQLSFWFPELEALIGVKQNPEFHPEGDVWNHTMLALDKAAAYRSRVSDPMTFMLAVLVHDFGKAVSSEEINGVVHAYEHEKTGVPIAENFLKRITGEKKLIATIKNLVLYHMKPNVMAKVGSSIKKTNHLFDECDDPEALIYLALADYQASGDLPPSQDIENFLFERLEIYKKRIKLPEVSGTDLINAGIKPGPLFSDMLMYSHKLHLSGVDKDAALKQTLSYFKKL